MKKSDSQSKLQRPIRRDKPKSKVAGTKASDVAQGGAHYVGCSTLIGVRCGPAVERHDIVSVQLNLGDIINNKDYSDTQLAFLKNNIDVAKVGIGSVDIGRLINLYIATQSAIAHADQKSVHLEIVKLCFPKNSVELNTAHSKLAQFGGE
jgi:hypothetical protein